MGFAIAKQPIFDRNGNIFAYELFLWKSNNIHEYPQSIPYTKATYMSLEILIDNGIDKIGEGKKIMLNISLDVLLNRVLESLPLKYIIFEIMPPQIPVGYVLLSQASKSMKKLAEGGALFSVNYELTLNKVYKNLIDQSDMITIKQSYIDSKALDLLKTTKHKILVSLIEREEEYKRAVTVGDYFSGRYLSSPTVIPHHYTIPYLKENLLRAMNVMEKVYDVEEIAKIISYDVGLSAKILKFLKSVNLDMTDHKTGSIEEACAILGIKRLKNFIFLIIINSLGNDQNQDLWQRSLMRALACKEIASILCPELEREAYLTGLFSLLDEILEVDKVSFLNEANVKSEVVEGYTGSNQKLASILEVVKELEPYCTSLSVINSIHPAYEMALGFNTVRDLGISREKLINIIQDAYQKAEMLLSF